MRVLPAAAALVLFATLSLTAACGGGPVECGTNERASLSFPSCAALDQERESAATEFEATTLDRCYADQCAADAPADEAE